MAGNELRGARATHLRTTRCSPPLSLPPAELDTLQNDSPGVDDCWRHRIAAAILMVTLVVPDGISTACAAVAAGGMVLLVSLMMSEHMRERPARTYARSGSRGS